MSLKKSGARRAPATRHNAGQQKDGGVGSMRDIVNTTNILGIAGVFITAGAYWCKSRKDMLTMFLAMDFVTAGYFYLLDLPLLMSFSIVDMVINVVYSRYDNRNVPWKIIIAFMLVNTTCAIINWSGWLAILPLTYTVANAYFYGRRKPQEIRIWEFFALPLRGIYDILNGAWIYRVPCLAVTLSVSLSYFY